MALTIVCPAWEYNTVVDHKKLLSGRTAIILKWLWTTPLQKSSGIAYDTRVLHRPYFLGLTPIGFEYYAGHYRGEPFECLRDYRVQIKANSLVGYFPLLVPMHMDEFKSAIGKIINGIDYIVPVHEKILSRAQKIRRIAELTAALFNNFLIIHPYANGNGHIARILATAMFWRYGIVLRRFPISHRPADPPYSELVRKYQSGDTEPFIVYLINCI